MCQGILCAVEGTACDESSRYMHEVHHRHTAAPMLHAVSGICHTAVLVETADTQGVAAHKAASSKGPNTINKQASSGPCCCNSCYSKTQRSC